MKMPLHLSCVFGNFEHKSTMWDKDSQLRSLGPYGFSDHHCGIQSATQIRLLYRIMWGTNKFPKAHAHGELQKYQERSCQTQAGYITPCLKSVICDVQLPAVGPEDIGDENWPGMDIPPPPGYPIPPPIDMLLCIGAIPPMCWGPPTTIGFEESGWYPALLQCNFH